METAQVVKILLTSPDFNAGEEIPAKHTCDGDNLSPALVLDNIPPEAKSLAIIMDDPDAPSGTWTHWLVWDIPPATEIEENYTGGTMGKNDFGSIGFQGPCPPIGTHRYFIRVYALDVLLGLAAGSTRDELLKAMEYHIIGAGELMGVYSQSS